MNLEGFSKSLKRGFFVAKCPLNQGPSSQRSKVAWFELKNLLDVGKRPFIVLAEIVHRGVAQGQQQGEHQLQRMARVEDDGVVELVIPTGVQEPNSSPTPGPYVSEVRIIDSTTGVTEARCGRVGSASGSGSAAS